MYITHKLVSPGVRRWIWPGALALTCLLAAAGGEAARLALRWQADLLVHEPWRLLTGHLVHLDGGHLALNVAGLAVAWALVGNGWRPREWTLIALFCAVAIGGGLAAVSGLEWYVGLSGVLHGLLAAGAIGLWRTWRVGSLMLFAFLAGKGLWEAFVGPVSAGEVIVEAHWIGTVAGTAVGILCDFVRRRTAG